jgi:phosphoribosyl 1,2-cyclic phosphodiesterase
VRIVPLASGSQGNSTLLESRGVRLLIDAGLPVDELEQRLGAAGVRPRQVNALFVTHRHQDHLRGATELSARHRIAVYTTRRTARAIGSEARRHVRRIEPNHPFAIGHLRGLAIPVCHDAPETMALLVEDGPLRYGHATDLGCADGAIGYVLQDCTALLLEFNYDERMLEAGSDPPHLKRRIGGHRGHLGNAQAAALLTRLAHPRLRHVFVAHVSERNNTPELALAAARAALGPDHRARVVLAAQHGITAAAECVPS